MNCSHTLRHPPPLRPFPLNRTAPGLCRKSAGWERSGWGWGQLDPLWTWGPGPESLAEVTEKQGLSRPCGVRGRWGAHAQIRRPVRSPRALTACVHSPTALRTGRGLPEGPGDRKALWRQKPPQRRASAYKVCLSPSFSEIQESAVVSRFSQREGTPDVVKERLAEPTTAFPLEPWHRLSSQCWTVALQGSSVWSSGNPQVDCPCWGMFSPHPAKE